MKISYNWLKTYIPQIPTPKDLEHIFTFQVCEVEDVITLPDDTIFDIKILPDRAGDLLSHMGVARELSGLLGISYCDPTVHYKTPTVTKTQLEVDIQTPQCLRYMGRIVRGVTVGPSPSWVVTYLESIGQRSINNIVDATNLVMFDCGHPVHAFDLKKLENEKIFVSESMNEYELRLVGSENNIVKIKKGDLIVSDTQRPIALAGIKGGVDSGISINEMYTTDIVLEVANFNKTSIRKTGQRLSLFTDARKRFENSVPIELASYAMRELSALIVELCPNAVFEDIVDVYPDLQEKKVVSFTTQIIEEKLGLRLTALDICTILQNYGYGYVEENGNFIVHIPFWRQDITGIHDFVEEIGRIYGYEKIEGVLPVFPKNQINDQVYFEIESVKEYFIKNGYSEVMTYSFTKKGERQVSHGLKGKDHLRTNLADGLKESFELNRLNAPLLGLFEIKIFEIGTVFLADREEIHVGCMTKKGIKEFTLSEFIKINDIAASTSLVIPEKKEYSPFKHWSVYPYVYRDISFWTNTELTEFDFILKIQDGLSELCVKTPYVVDTFLKDGRYSYAFRFVFQSHNKTLTDQDIEGQWNKILELVIAEGWEIR